METNVLIQIATLALILEALVQTVKPVWDPDKRTVVFYVNLAVGMLVSVGATYLADLDLFAAVGVPLSKLPIAGVIMTGILISRGANFMHDLIQLAQKLKIRVDPEKPE